MTTTTDIARAHGYTGPMVCEDCGTTECLHFGSWFDPEAQESGDFLQCCACGLKAGDPADIHADCESDADEVEEADVDAVPEVRVLHHADGWTLRGEPGPEACTSNFHRQQDGRPACTDAAVWKVVEHFDLGLTLSFWCDSDLPDEHRPLPAPPPHAAR